MEARPRAPCPADPALRDRAGRVPARAAERRLRPRGPGRSGDRYLVGARARRGGAALARRADPADGRGDRRDARDVRARRRAFPHLGRQRRARLRRVQPRDALPGRVRPGCRFRAPGNRGAVGRRARLRGCGRRNPGLGEPSVSAPDRRGGIESSASGRPDLPQLPHRLLERSGHPAGAELSAAAAHRRGRPQPRGTRPRRGPAPRCGHRAVSHVLPRGSGDRGPLHPRVHRALASSLRRTRGRGRVHGRRRGGHRRRLCSAGAR